jgi:perosamine synthetase
MSDTPSSLETIDHPPEWPVYDEVTKQRAHLLIENNRSFDYARGSELSRLENDFSVRHGGLLAVTFNSGTSALYAAFRAFGFVDGAEVVVPTFNFLSAASPLVALGSIPVFCDVRRQDGNASVEDIESCVTTQTKGVVVTHLFGNPCDMASISAFCRSRGLTLIEDCSHAHASRYGGRPLGTHGNAAVYSLGAQKMVTGGHGGVLLTRSPDVHDIACLVGHFKHRSRASVIDGDLKRFEDFGLGGNLRMSPIAAVLANGLLDTINEISSDKDRLAQRLMSTAEELLGLERLTIVPSGENATHYDVVLALPSGATANDRDHLVNELRRLGLRVRTPATRLLHLSSIMTADEDEVMRLPLSRTAVTAMRQRARQRSFSCAADLHDRLISFPSACLYGKNDALVSQYESAMARARSLGLSV